jgi:hypothetical protein
MDMGCFRNYSIGPSLLFLRYEEKIIKEGNLKQFGLYFFILIKLDFILII